MATRKYLSYQGLTYLWSKIKEEFNKKQDRLIPGNLVSMSGNQINVISDPSKQNVTSFAIDSSVGYTYTNPENKQVSVVIGHDSTKQDNISSSGDVYTSWNNAYVNSNLKNSLKITNGSSNYSKDYGIALKWPDNYSNPFLCLDMQRWHINGTTQGLSPNSSRFVNIANSSFSEITPGYVYLVSLRIAQEGTGSPEENYGVECCGESVYVSSGIWSYRQITWIAHPTTSTPWNFGIRNMTSYNFAFTYQFDILRLTCDSYRNSQQAENNTRYYRNWT